MIIPLVLDSWEKLKNSAAVDPDVSVRLWNMETAPQTVLSVI